VDFDSATAMSEFGKRVIGRGRSRRRRKRRGDMTTV
jgi:hypothetical protein